LDERTHAEVLRLFFAHFNPSVTEINRTAGQALICSI
jgi:hypothetical protein